PGALGPPADPPAAPPLRRPPGPAGPAGARAGPGRTLAAAGLNVNLAPVLDVYERPGNFIDAKQRSYGHDPRTVGLLTAAFTAAQAQEGVAGTAKHFPGLGTAPAGANTDEGPVTLADPLEELRAVGEAPYPAALAAGARLVMLSWAAYPALDAARPAGLSPVVVQQELRGRLGFTGVTVSDALEAGSLDAFGSTGERAVAAAAAGIDLILCSARDAAQGERAAAGLAAALDDGTLDRTAFTGALARVDALRAGLR
ncbi:glycoside hydrolase family 3 N-terminal domain-containing protein, partial [Kitasatospora sp. NPDC059571]|uniref:glycoside hydrolase family 3 N-terminal domain-containing protein n=1 Tax=Kitasatospora sp. NPDC059571 TaxID=3346871 RepID=UPI00368D7680